MCACSSRTSGYLVKLSSKMLTFRLTDWLRSPEFWHCSKAKLCEITSHIHQIVSTQGTKGSQLHTASCSWIHHALNFLVLCSRSQILHFVSRGLFQTVLCGCFFAEGALGIRDQECQGRENAKGLSGACDSRLTNDRCINTNPTTRN